MDNNTATITIREQNTEGANEKTQLDESQLKSNFLWMEYLVTVEVSLLMGIVGIHFGWVGPTLAILLNKSTTPMQVTSSEAAWISGFLQIGSIIGPFLGIYLIDTRGRKSAILFCTIPNLLSFLITYLASKVWMLYCARLLGGVAVGISYLVAPIYVSEISSSIVRGRLGILLGLMYGIGYLLQFSIVPFVGLKINAIICLVIVIVQSCTVLLLPETPYFYIMKNKPECAEETLKYLRRKSSVTNELNQLQIGWHLQNVDGQPRLVDIFKTRLNRKCVFISFGVMLAVQLSGATAINSYTLIILEEAKAPISANLSAILLALLNVIFTLVASFVVDNWGRKPLFVLSAIFSGLPLIVIGLFYYLKTNNFENISNLSLIPVFGLLIFLFGYSVGFAALPYSYASEIFPTRFKAIAGMYLTTFAAILSLIVTKAYQIIGDMIGIQFCFWIFGVFCAFSAVFIVISVPETKGKTLEEIQMELHSSILIKPLKNELQK